ncbi:inhibitor of Bruton tyrosine kinase-like [Castor canadensis]|uniref:Inhibitor of Bruton tyrosine kinase-like n=1 Tax=Castor canadensis TaxID=51338 RepID=A0AC58M4R1_CASCN
MDPKSDTRRLLKPHIKLDTLLMLISHLLDQSLHQIWNMSSSLRGTNHIFLLKTGYFRRIKRKSRQKESQNVDFICSVLVVADQLLITRLKEICEVALTEKLTLKNAAMLLEFAAMYSAEQLKLSCLQFIGLNMAALLEARSLDVLSDDVLKDLSVFYRKVIPAMDRRVITPYQEGPDISHWK